MAAELWLVRHGETDWNLQGLYQGQADIPLNETGLAQARQTAAALDQAGQSFAAIYSSPLARALQTAEECACRLGLEVRLVADLREIHQGEWQGKNYAAVVAQFSDHPRVELRAPGGESVAEVAARMAAAADEIAAAHAGEAVLIFSHGLALATLVCQARGIPLSEVYAHIPANGQADVIGWPAQG
jgi:broad specificity phosphatase PhoE